MRKHYTQMGKEEIAATMSAVRKNEFTLHGHAKIKMEERKLTLEQLKACLSYGSIIEVHNDAEPEIRALVRGKVNGAFACVVVSLTTKQVITVYWNPDKSYHKDLDLSKYTWQADLLKLKELQ